jgi:uroporphyrinogen-III synthase
MLPRVTVQLALRTVSLESRRAEEMARLLARHGLVPIEAPSLREVALSDQREALAFGAALMAGECDWVVLLTGVGTRALIETLATRWPKDAVVRALGRASIACRGPKPVAALKEIGLKPAVTAPEPNTWRDLVAALAPVELGGKRIWVQEYGRPNEALVEALGARGADVHSAAVYAWQLPEDVGPLRRAVDALCDGAADAILFTSARQLDHLLEVAAQIGREPALRSALAQRVLVVSIGPVTSEALAEQGLRADLEPPHPKMGHMVKALAERGLERLEHKRGTHG